MDKMLLGFKPKRFLCPYCGKWHDWNKRYSLIHYNSETCQAELECFNEPYECDKTNYRIYFYDNYCYYSTDPICLRANQSIKGKISISSIIESKDNPIVTFEVPLTTEDYVGSDECSNCVFKNRCICVKLGDEGDHRHMTITFGFEFEQSDYFSKSRLGSVIEHMLEKWGGCEQTIDSKEQALKERKAANASKAQDLKEHEATNASKAQVFQQPQVRENKEDTTMANNIFNTNMEFGPNKDKNITSTLMGVAVKNGDSWRIYDKKKKEITDFGGIKLGNFPIFILPTTKLSEGDLIKDNDEYYFVTKVATSETPAQTISIRTGEIKNVVPVKNILGFSCYSKVIALSDSLNIGDDIDVEKLAIMSAMCGQTNKNGGQMSQLLPLMLFKDKLGKDDDMMKLLLMSSMMTYEEDDSQMDQWIPF